MGKIQKDRDIFLEDRLTKADDANRIIKWSRESNIVLDRLLMKKSKKNLADWKNKNKSIKELLRDVRSRFKQDLHRRLADEALGNFETYEKRLERFLKTGSESTKNSSLDHLEIAENARQLYDPRIPRSRNRSFGC